MAGPLRITMLGSGTSTGVPVVGCHCVVCRSPHPKNHRLRPSILLQTNETNFLFDTSTDLRQQALRFGIPRLDAVFYTHHHADHVNGIDELRAFNFVQEGPIPIYANHQTMDRIQRYFEHIFSEDICPGGKANVTMHIVGTDPVCVNGVILQPIPLEHFEAVVTGYRVGPFAYLTDCKKIPEGSWPLLQGVTHLILDCLRYTPHVSHMNLEEALAVVARLRPKRTVFTHITHEFDHDTVNAELPPGVELGFDGFIMDVPIS